MLCLFFKKFSIGSTETHQMLVGPLFFNISTVKYKNPIGHFDG